MNIKVNGRDVEITDDIQSYVDKKFNRLSRHLPQMMDATAEIKRTSSRSGDDRIVVQLTLTVKGQVLAGSAAWLDRLGSRRHRR